MNHSTAYIDADTLQDARNAYACGVPLQTLAAQLATSEGDLRRLLGLPAWQEIDFRQQVPGRLSGR